MITAIKISKGLRISFHSNNITSSITAFLQKKVTRQNVRLFFKRNSRTINFFQYGLIIISLGFILAGFQELMTLKEISKPEFINPYCSHNFPHHYNTCISFLKTLVSHYIYDAGRFFLVPLIIFLGWGVYEGILKEKIQTYLHQSG